MYLLDPRLGNALHQFQHLRGRAGRSLSSGQPGLHREFQASQSYIVRPLLQKQQNKDINRKDQNQTRTLSTNRENLISPLSVLIPFMSLSSRVALAKILGTVIKKEGESIHMLSIFEEMLSLSPFNVGYRVVVCILQYKCEALQFCSLYS